jgi:hypothetical protein
MFYINLPVGQTMLTQNSISNPHSPSGAVFQFKAHCYRAVRTKGYGHFLRRIQGLTLLYHLINQADPVFFFKKYYAISHTVSKV